MLSATATVWAIKPKRLTKEKLSNEKNRLIAFALSVSLLLGASACGKPAKTVSELIAEENAILDQHQELWTTALNSLDKDNLSQSTQSTNYADVLDLAIKNVKDQLSDEGLQDADRRCRQGPQAGGSAAGTSRLRKAPPHPPATRSPLSRAKTWTATLWTAACSLTTRLRS